MISGEYLILKGAKSLALPVRLGQTMRIYESIESPSFFKWKSSHQDLAWFRAELSRKDFSIISTNNKAVGRRLNELLCVCRELNPAFLIDRKSYLVENNLEFNKDWGLGSSSSLISNLAYWADIDPFLLNEKSFGGSAYDVACARTNSAIIYQLIDGHRIVTPVEFAPSFNEQLFFVWLGKKQNSSKEVKRFLKLDKGHFKEVESIGEITDEMLKAVSLYDFMRLMGEHEKLIASVIRTKKLKDRLFNDFQGEIKSLGAWGGDFILCATERDETYVRKYFNEKNCNVICAFKKLVL